MVDSAENINYRATLAEKVKKANDSITSDCEKQASELAEKASRKRVRDIPPEEASTSNKRPKTTSRPTSLNNTQDRDSMLLKLYDAVDDVSPHLTIKKQTHNIISSPLTDPSQTGHPKPRPTRPTKPWPRPKQRPRMGSEQIPRPTPAGRRTKRKRRRTTARPPKHVRMVMKRKQRKRKQRTTLRRNKKLNKNTNIVNLSSYTLTLAESILSKGLSFIPKPKNIDLPDAQRGLRKLRNQIANIYEAHKKKEQTTTTSQNPAPSDATETQTQTRDPLSGYITHKKP